MARWRAIVVAGSVLVAGCASIFEGTTQQISVNTTPTGARCTFWKNGTLVGDIAVTPGSAIIRKSKDDLFIVCDKPGYASATYINRSGLAMVTWANILTAGLAWAVDSSRGADNKYESAVNVALSPVAVPAPVAVPRAAEPEPEPVPSGPMRTAGPLPPPTPPIVPSPQLNCVAADGSRIRVTGAACPAGWTAAQ